MHTPVICQGCRTSAGFPDLVLTTITRPRLHLGITGIFLLEGVEAEPEPSDVIIYVEPLLVDVVYAFLDRYFSAIGSRGYRA